MKKECKLVLMIIKKVFLKKERNYTEFKPFVLVYYKGRDIR